MVPTHTSIHHRRLTASRAMASLDVAPSDPPNEPVALVRCTLTPPCCPPPHPRLIRPRRLRVAAFCLGTAPPRQHGTALLRHDEAPTRAQRKKSKVVSAPAMTSRRIRLHAHAPDLCLTMNDTGRQHQHTTSGSVHTRGLNHSLDHELLALVSQSSLRRQSRVSRGRHCLSAEPPRARGSHVT